ncbi:Glucanosyltransferase-domain-containing protein [Trichophaea hybrida]|nr:Glucanosyltransferase-domain-containing protein [Trichophaea hybrida]
MSSAATGSTTLEPIVMKDRHFFGANSGNPFFIRGVDYQPGGSADFKKGQDPLSDIDSCSRDIYLFQQLGINTIRVYSVDPALDHDACMTLMASAGIYLVLDVNTPLLEQHLNNKEPWTTYTENYLQHVFSVIEVFSGYTNTLAFLAGNEVVFDKVSAKTSPNYLKAVVRDMKAYITEQVSRIIPVGYSNADDLKFRISLAKYLECGEIGYIDFFGVNSYQWCGHNTFVGSGYDKLVEDYTDYSLPVFFTEFGCNESPPRLWEEIGSLYNANMTNVFSGGLVYEYSQETNNYGLVDISKTGQAKTMKDYTSLAQAYKKAGTDIPLPSGHTAPTRPSTCPAEDDKIFDNITANLTLPFTFGTDMIKNGLGGKVTRGKFLSDLSTRATKYAIVMDGQTVSNKEVKDTYKLDYTPLKAGGHGQNTGGGVGAGAPTTGSGKKSTASAVAGPRAVMYLGSLGAVALAFGLFL